MRAFSNVLSSLLAVATVVQALSISGDYVCGTNSGCNGALLDVASGTDFSLQCAAENSCEGSQIVVHSECTLRPNGIDCSPQFACKNAKIVVFSSDLAAISSRFLDCFNAGQTGGLCKEMNMTLVDSSIILYCGKNDCDNMKVFLFGSSTLELKSGSKFNSNANNALTIYVSKDSTLIHNGLSGYNLVSIPNQPTTTTSTTMTPTSTRLLPTTMTPTMTSTLIPSTTTLTTSTTTIIPQTTTQIRMTTTKSTAIPSVTSASSTPNPTTVSHIPKSTISATSVPRTTTTATDGFVSTISTGSITVLTPTTTFPTDSSLTSSMAPKTTSTTDTRPQSTEMSTLEATFENKGATGVLGIGWHKFALICLILGALVLLCTVICAYRHGKRSSRRKQEQSEEKEEKVHIALVPSNALNTEVDNSGDSQWIFSKDG